MICYEKIDCSAFIDFSGKGVKYIICRYSYFPDGCKYQPYTCNNCHDFSMTVMNLSDFYILKLRVLIIESILLVLIKKKP